MQPIKSLVSRFGGYLYGPGSVPKGISLFHDIKRYGWSHCVDLIIDVGANTGQFAFSALTAVPHCSVISFEPVTQSFHELKIKADSDPRWTAIHSAVGDTNGSVLITCEGTSQMNHIKRQVDEAELHYSTVKYENVPLAKLDDVCNVRCINTISMLKTDTEGFDAQVLLGASELLANNSVFSVLAEVSFDSGDICHSHFSEIIEILGPKFKVAGFYGQGCDGLNGVIDRLDVFFVNSETIPIK